MGINNPLPASLRSECRKASRILASFVDPKQSFGPDKIIPPSVLSNAKGLAIITVLKAGFLFSGRVGSGLVVARKGDGSWSAPSAIATAGAGFGGQIGAELTDFVMILNDSNAVKTFAQVGSITLGGNVSVAAGPVGRNAEASGAASLRSIAGIFSYSKTKGLFAGVSLEGSVIVERKDANKKFYGGNVSAKQLLSGSIGPPHDADALIRILNSRVFSGNLTGMNYDDMYNDIPTYDSDKDESIWEGQSGNAYGEGTRRGSIGNRNLSRSSTWKDDRDSGSPRVVSRASTWQDDVYDRDRDRGRDDPADSAWRASHRPDPAQTFDKYESSKSTQFQRQHFNSTYSDKSPSPKRPTGPKPVFKPKPLFTNKAELNANQAIALYTFEADQPGDLGFKKGDIITIVKKTDSKNDWWTGEINGKTGIFPSNYVETM
ncbi:unnamed protein product [Tuber melanosporum]|uniref:(Perigord truffle) hypothetical protein n=1 Tax=Tuber melanosporum (strain Mel28) TaxID=656061 RepID=D5GFJ9_TUBMM|nr:uncharacterized protein GSTUM_00006942001 [Tuber melanosporum]CAZ83292.1 unnamed protein product [Tuber melanosporum]